MKRNIYKIVYGLLLMAIVSSCDQENLGAIYTPDENEPVGLSLLWEEGSLVYTPDATEGSIPVVRSNASGALTVPLIATYDEDVFSLPASVTFADGEYQALIKFSLENTALSTEYDIDIELDVDSASLVKFGTFKSTVDEEEVTKTVAYGYKMASVVVMKDYAWESLGEASFNSTWFVEDGLPVQMQKASGQDIYRAIDIYADGYNMLITVNGTTATVARQQIDLSSGVAPIFVEGSGTFINNVFTLTLDFKMYYPTLNDLYYQELGDVEVITLPAQE